MASRRTEKGRGARRAAKRKRDPFAPFRVSRPTQIVTKSDQLFKDVEFLYKQKRFALVLYLGGFVVECLLKAALWKRRHERGVRELLFGHDLARLLAASPVLSRDMERDRLGAYNYFYFVRVSSWHVGIRYNPKQVAPEDADAFLTQLREVRRWLRNRI